MFDRQHIRRVAAAAAVAAATLAIAGVADADQWQVHLTPADQAAARADVLSRADIGPGSGWSGATVKPGLSSTLPCPGFHPKQSDLVVTGAAERDWTHAGFKLTSEAVVLKTARMIDLDWKRSVVAPQLASCLRTVLARSLGSKAQLVSFRPLSLPGVAARLRAYRLIMDVPTAAGKVRMLDDLVVAMRGRTEITFSAIAPYAVEPLITAADARLMRVLVARARA
jgi:hypothetical protein